MYICALQNHLSSLLQSRVVCCSLLKCTAMCCSVLQCVAVCCHGMCRARGYVPCAPIYPSTHLPIYPSTHLPIYPSTHLPIYPSTHLPGVVCMCTASVHSCVAVRCSVLQYIAGRLQEDTPLRPLEHSNAPGECACQ